MSRPDVRLHSSVFMSNKPNGWVRLHVAGRGGRRGLAVIVTEWRVVWGGREGLRS